MVSALGLLGAFTSECRTRKVFLFESVVVKEKAELIDKALVVCLLIVI